MVVVVMVVVGDGKNIIMLVGGDDKGDYGDEVICVCPLPPMF
jgi:hypothetical protein